MRLKWSNLTRLFGESQLKHRPTPRRLSLESLEERCLLTTAYLQTNLISDLSGVALNTDANLVNPWGIAYSPTGAFWVADNGAGLATNYNAGGQPFTTNTPGSVTIPPPNGSTATAAPTGEVFNSTSNFVITSGQNSAAATFLFATEDGTISGWNASVNATAAILEVDNSANPSAGNGAVYKGLTIGSNSTGNFIYAANFRSGTIDVFNSTFVKTNLAGTFTDPSLPAGFAPFNIQNIGGQLYVTYAKQDASKHDDVPGPGNGYIDVFDTNGNFVKHFASQGTLNSPWGMTIAPPSFGSYSNDLLVGNFGDGRINVYNPSTGTFLAQIQDGNGNPISINGLWDLIPGNGGTAGSTNTIYYTAGFAGEQHGLFGTLQALSANQHFVSQVYLDLLHRPVDPEGLGSWSTLLDQGTTTTQVVLDIEGSLEYRVDEVQSLYSKYLHRLADASGLSAFSNFLANGGTLEQAASNIIGSAEYFSNRAGSTNNGFLSALYQDTLGRPIDAGGQAFFTNLLNNNTSRTQVAADVLSSTEYGTDLVKGFYVAYLRRQADSAGLAAFLGAFQSGVTDQQIIADIVGSGEYYNRLGP